MALNLSSELETTVRLGKTVDLETTKSKECGTPEKRARPSKHDCETVEMNRHVTRSAPGGGVMDEESIWGSLHVLRSDMQEARYMVPLIKPMLTIGRASDSDIRVNLPWCSRKHLCLKEKHIHDSKAPGGVRRVAVLERTSKFWKTTSADGKSIAPPEAEFHILKDNEVFVLCNTKYFRIRIMPIGMTLEEHEQREKDQLNRYKTANNDVSKISECSVEGRPATIKRSINPKKRKRRRENDKVNDSSIISDSLLQSPLQGTPKDLKADFHSKSFENGGSFQGSFLLDHSHDSKGNARASIIGRRIDDSIDASPSPMPMPSPEQQPSAMKFDNRTQSGVPESLKRAKSVRFGAFNEEACIDPRFRCAVTPSKKKLSVTAKIGFLSCSAKKRMQQEGKAFALTQFEKATLGMGASPMMPHTPTLGLGLMTQHTSRIEDDVQCHADEFVPRLQTTIQDVMKMPKARKLESLLPQLDQLRLKLIELTKMARAGNIEECKKDAFEFMKFLQALPYEHPVMDRIKASLKSTTLTVSSLPKGGSAVAMVKNLWEGLMHLKRNPGDVSSLRLDIVNCICNIVTQAGPSPDKVRQQAGQECNAMFSTLASMVDTEVKNIPELAGKRLGQGIKRLVSLEHHKAEEIIIKLSQKLEVTDRRSLAEAAEISLRCGLKYLLKTPANLALLTAEHRNMAISSLTQLMTSSSSGLTGLLTSTAKELNTFGVHNNAIIIGISFIMAQPMSTERSSNPFLPETGTKTPPKKAPNMEMSKQKDTSAGGRLFFNSTMISSNEVHASFLEGQESTIIGKSAMTPDCNTRRFSRKDQTPYLSKVMEDC